MIEHAEAKRGQLLAAVESIAVPLGFHPASIMVQAELESGRFKKIIGLNNYWGIKVPKSIPWTGTTARVITSETFTDPAEFVKFVNKHIADILSIGYNEKQKLWWVKLWDVFCDWPFEPAAVEYYTALVKRLYPVAYALRHDPPRYFTALVSGKRKWATDIVYAQSLIDLWNQLRPAYERQG